MKRQQLIEQLAQLHADLSRTERVDPESLELLGKLTDQLRQLDDDKIAAAAASEDDEDGITSGLKELLLKFEAEHPQLSAAVGKVADALATIGI